MQNEILENLYGDKIFDIGFVNFFYITERGGYEEGIVMSDEYCDRYGELEEKKSNANLTKNEEYELQKMEDMFNAHQNGIEAYQFLYYSALNERLDRAGEKNKKITRMVEDLVNKIKAENNDDKETLDKLDDWIDNSREREKRYDKLKEEFKKLF